MKKYITPTITMSRFSGENIVTASTPAEGDGYVTGLRDVEQRTQVSLNDVKPIVKFAF